MGLGEPLSTTKTVQVHYISCTCIGTLRSSFMIMLAIVVVTNIFHFFLVYLTSKYPPKNMSDTLYLFKTIGFMDLVHCLL